MRKGFSLIFLFSFLLSALSFTTSGHAIQVTPDTNASNLVQALTAGANGIVVTGSSVDVQTLGQAVSSGTYINPEGTYGIGNGIVLSTGNVSDYSTGPNRFPDNTTGYFVPATPTQDALLNPITGSFPHFDVTQLNITFNLLPGYNGISLKGVFGSEEFPEDVGSIFIDAFGAYLNGQNIALVNSLPVNINNPYFAAVPGTELNGVIATNGNPVLTFAGSAAEGSTGNTLTLIIGDTSDDQLDSTVYLSGLTGTQAAPSPSAVPEPATLVLLGSGLLSSKLFRKKI